MPLEKEARMSRLKTERKRAFIGSVILILATVIAAFFIHSLKSDYHTSDDYIQKSIGQELEEITSNGEPVDIKRATSLITLALDRTYENYVIDILYLLLVAVLGVLLIYSIVIIKLKLRVLTLEVNKESQ